MCNIANTNTSSKHGRETISSELLLLAVTEPNCNCFDRMTKRRRSQKSVNFSASVNVHWVVKNTDDFKVSWYDIDEVNEMKRDARKALDNNPSLRTDNIMKLLTELDHDNSISSDQRRESARRRLDAFTVVLMEQLRQWTAGENDKGRLAAVYREISQEATMLSRRLALADEIVAKAILFGL